MNFCQFTRAGRARLFNLHAERVTIDPSQANDHRRALNDRAGAHSARARGPSVKSRRPRAIGRTALGENAILRWAGRSLRFMPANHPKKPDEPTDGEEMGRILRFEPRHGARRARPSPPPPGGSPVEGVDKYARQPEDS